MALPRSGELGLRSINAELGRPTSAEISLDTAENGGYGAINTASPTRPSATNPAAVSEWYGYTHSGRLTFSCTFSSGATRTGTGTLSGNVTNINADALFSGQVYGGTGSRGIAEAYYYIGGRLTFDLVASPNSFSEGADPNNPYPPGTRTYQIQLFAASINATATYFCTQA